MQAQPVTLKTLPPELVDGWKTKDGLIRVEALPKGDPNDNDNLRKFADAVLAAEPNAIGGPVSILKSGDTVVKAFIHAGIWALLVISLLLWLALRRFTDVLLTLVPLLVAGAVTMEICVLIGLPLNFANIVALPLLLGIGVAFKIYYVMAWRSGRTNLLQTSLTRAIFFSALTTATAFGSLWLSSHPGTASMGKLLALSLRHHAGRGAAVPARANGQTARCRGVGRYRRRDRRPPPASEPATASGAGAGLTVPVVFGAPVAPVRRRPGACRAFGCRAAGFFGAPLAMLLAGLEGIGGPTRVQVSPPHRKPSTQPWISSWSVPTGLMVEL